MKKHLSELEQKLTDFILEAIRWGSFVKEENILWFLSQHGGTYSEVEVYYRNLYPVILGEVKERRQRAFEKFRKEFRKMKCYKDTPFWNYEIEKIFEHEYNAQNSVFKWFDDVISRR